MDSMLLLVKNEVAKEGRLEVSVQVCCEGLTTRSGDSGQEVIETQ